MYCQQTADCSKLKFPRQKYLYGCYQTNRKQIRIGITSSGCLSYHEPRVPHVPGVCLSISVHKTCWKRFRVHAHSSLVTDPLPLTGAVHQEGLALPSLDHFRCVLPMACSAKLGTVTTCSSKRIEWKPLQKSLEPQGWSPCPVHDLVLASHENNAGH